MTESVKVTSSARGAKLVVGSLVFSYGLFDANSSAGAGWRFFIRNGEGKTETFTHDEIGSPFFEWEAQNNLLFAVGLSMASLLPKRSQKQKEEPPATKPVAAGAAIHAGKVLAAVQAKRDTITLQEMQDGWSRLDNDVRAALAANTEWAKLKQEVVSRHDQNTG